MSLGRNDPCFCGSGVKYKKCCLMKTQSHSLEDLSYRRLRETEKKLIGQLFRHASEVFGPSAIKEAWDEFHCWQYSEGYDLGNSISQIFGPFFLFSWQMDPEDTDCDLKLEDKTIAESFLETRRSKLSSDEIKILESANRTAFSFYEVTDVTPDFGFTLRNVMTEQIYEVIERSGSQGAKRGDFLFGAIFQFDGRFQILAMSPYMLPPLSMGSLIELRKRMLRGLNAKTLTDADLSEYDIELRQIYFKLLDNLLNPKMPEITNTDGDPLVPQTLHFEIDDPQVAFESLKSLALGVVNDHGLTREAKFKDGRLVEVEIPWFKENASNPNSGSNTVLGRVKIVGSKLTANVNSDRRAAVIKKKILSELGDQVRFKTTLIETIEGNLGAASSQKGGKSQSISLDQLPPEALESVKKMAEAHWEKWFDEKIPALNHKTPKQAAKSKEGRELLDALLNSYEQHSANDHERANLFQPDISKLRAKLGLPSDG